MDLPLILLNTKLLAGYVVFYYQCVQGDLHNVSWSTVSKITQQGNVIFDTMSLIGDDNFVHVFQPCTEKLLSLTFLGRFNMYKVVSCLFNFKQMRNLLATSFLQNKRYGLQAREQGFPKLCPTLPESRYRAMSLACNEASNLGGRIYATVPGILLTVWEKDSEERQQKRQQK